ncbi:helix-turn-helix domain-containing protein [Anaerobium acetethylicum]|uniref:Helix-turn-helix n=1 Tax=Anaerobium acetethylicum TaxID=1619234 RepID=A0A1D3TSQ1_9FIRM|nr:helix-turn-helix domain-containing protein [Anaerobium acetethylicum]SCP96894.1 Helix-turn-helix [Anaerobium acetethylicum]
MDCSKTGDLISKIRKEKKMTQKQLAEQLNVSDKAVSKWERGLGCPDVVLLNELADLLGINVKELLSGDLNLNDMDGGNMKKTKFYACPNCGNMIASTGEVSLSCCGKNLRELEPKKMQEEDHELTVETVDNEYYVHLKHDMHKGHFISFVAYVTCDKLYVNRLYPEQNAEVRFRKSGHGMMYVFCTEHGLFRKLV